MELSSDKGYWVKGNESMERQRVFSRHITVLDTIAGAKSPRRFVDLLETIQMPKATLHRLLQTMVEEGLLRLDETTRTYHLGLKLISYGYAAMRDLDLRRQAERHLEALRDLTRETTRLAILDGTEMVYIDHKLSPQTISIEFKIGARGPAYCSGTGKAILAFLPPAERDRVIKRINLRALTLNTRASAKALVADLEKSRKRGFAIDDEEQTPGVRAVGVAVLDSAGKPVAAISVTVPAYRVSVDQLKRWAPQVIATAESISLDAGFRHEHTWKSKLSSIG